MTTVICPYCNQPAEWVENKEIYGRNYGKSYMMYYCRPCDAYVGCHNNTRNPLGTLANKELRELRKQAHRVIDPFWKEGLIERKHVYSRLRRHFGFHIHVGESDLDLCRRIVAEAPRLLEMSKEEFLAEYPREQS